MVCKKHRTDRDACVTSSQTWLIHNDWFQDTLSKLHTAAGLLNDLISIYIRFKLTYIIKLLIYIQTDLDFRFDDTDDFYIKLFVNDYMNIGVCLCIKIMYHGKNVVNSVDR